jgi:uncharacterized membrane protein
MNTKVTNMQGYPDAGNAPGQETSFGAWGGRKVNMDDTERWASGVSGGAIALLGFKVGGLPGLALAALGGGLVYRGLSGHCDFYDALGINTAHSPNAVPGSVKGIKVEKSVTINKSPAELYSFWRNFENLPKIMSHLEAVRVDDDKISHWVAKAPAGMTVEWDAEIINEIENELIAWRSLEKVTVPNAGSVRFQALPHNRGTIVKVTLSYEPPGGGLGAAVAKLFGEEPAQQVMEDLRRFKRMMEAGEVPTTEGQPSGREAHSNKESEQGRTGKEASARAFAQSR